MSKELIDILTHRLRNLEGTEEDRVSWTKALEDLLSKEEIKPKKPPVNKANEKIKLIVGEDNAGERLARENNRLLKEVEGLKAQLDLEHKQKREMIKAHKVNQKRMNKQKRNKQRYK